MPRDPSRKASVTMLTAEDFNIRAGQFLCLKRHDKGMSLAELAKAFPEDITRQSLSQIERGERQLSAHRLHNWAMALGFDPGQFYRDVTRDRYSAGRPCANEDLAIKLFVLAKGISDPDDINKLIEMAREFSEREVAI